MIGLDTIQDRLRAARARCGLSPALLAKRSGVTTSAIGNIEAGTRRQPRNIIRIAAALGETEEWLQYGTGESPTRALGLSLGQRLRALRAQSSKQDAAARCGVTRQLWSGLERDLIEPEDKTLRRIADQYGVTVEQLRAPGRVADAASQERNPQPRLSCDALTLIELIKETDGVQITDWKNVIGLVRQAAGSKT